eukprot:3303340-Pyramimonas_sp.AAC.1
MTPRGLGLWAPLDALGRGPPALPRLPGRLAGPCPADPKRSAKCSTRRRRAPRAPAKMTLNSGFLPCAFS